jgi:predicted Zn-dependent protease
VFRFAYDALHQNLVQEVASVTVKLIQDGRVGIATADTLDDDHLRRAANAAATIAKHAPTQPALPQLASGHRLRMTADYHAATARLKPVTCVTAIQRLFHLAKGAGAQLAGSMMTGEDELAVANSSGVSCYAASTVAGAKLVTMYRKLSGFASGVHRRFDRLDLDGLLRHALRQCLHREEPVTLPLGTYEVILEPEAVAELLEWLGSIAFGAKSVQHRTSFLAGRMGESVMHRQITIYDDGREPGSLRLPFDFEGVPKQRVVLIDRGKASSMTPPTASGSAIPPRDMP